MDAIFSSCSRYSSKAEHQLSIYFNVYESHNHLKFHILALMSMLPLTFIDPKIFLAIFYRISSKFTISDEHVQLTCTWQLNVENSIFRRKKNQNKIWFTAAAISTEWPQIYRSKNLLKEHTHTHTRKKVSSICVRLFIVRVGLEIKQN